MILLIAGTAGAGKSTLCSALKRLGFKIYNLDPGAVTLPYDPDFNIRNMYRLEEVMVKEKLGPNGALVHIFNNIEKKIKISGEDIAVDLPGQIEVFLRTNWEFIEGDAVGVYIMDGTKIKDFKEFVTQFLFYTIISLNSPFIWIRAVSKKDLLSKGDIEKIEKWWLGQETPKLPGVLGELMSELSRMLEVYGTASWPIFYSANSMEDVEELVARARETFCACGDLL